MGSDFAKFSHRLANIKKLKSKFGDQSLFYIVESIVKNLKNLNSYMKERVVTELMSPLQIIKYVYKDLELENDKEACQLMLKLYGDSICELSPEKMDQI
jgi:hypothetical protein